MTCNSEVDTAYYSAKCRLYLPPVCIYFGTPDSLLDDNDAYVANLYSKYSIVRRMFVLSTFWKRGKNFGRQEVC
ncbi:hypothetical protein DPMN_113316 [Dreissena polymorpha]|uniref:Uncharacterized protein n=1 Tax=Dreissena polymorpha TaxID=45954 RepID=A0A9D4KII8_DREPO|nr:hypothetical protein DPMN_113316 [Dreissena polymorpha]